jgi:hypothetical protein
MEHFLFFRYTWGYETPRNPTTTGKAAPTSYPVVESRKTPVGCGPLAWSLQELCLPMVSSLQKEGAPRSSPPTDSRASCQVIQSPEEEACKTAAGWAPGLRLPDRPLDIEEDRTADPQILSHPVSSQPCLAVAFRDRVELPETRAPGFAKGRRRDRLLEALPVAPYKKTPKGLGPIWSFSMSPAFCSFPTSPVPGESIPILVEISEAAPCVRQATFCSY